MSGPEGGPAVDPAPLVLTLVLDERSQARFDRLRRAHFPPARNHLAAHVTLFHALPSDGLAVVEADVQAAAARPSFDVAVTGLRSLGRGVAYELASDDLHRVRDGLAARWRDRLTAQDRAGHRPHVTVQNKVAPAEAEALLAALAAGFRPWTARAEGLALWRYRGGPWEHHRTVRFSAG